VVRGGHLELRGCRSGGACPGTTTDAGEAWRPRIASGADVKVVQQMLGHSSAAMTVDVYGHLFSDRLGEVADALPLNSDGAPGGIRTCAPASGGRIR
jgi:hypothetical protein